MGGATGMVRRDDGGACDLEIGGLGVGACAVAPLTLGGVVGKYPSYPPYLPLWTSIGQGDKRQKKHVPNNERHAARDGQVQHTPFQPPPLPLRPASRPPCRSEYPPQGLSANRGKQAQPGRVASSSLHRCNGPGAPCPLPAHSSVSPPHGCRRASCKLRSRYSEMERVPEVQNRMGRNGVKMR